jgi:hypothetical protein
LTINDQGHLHPLIEELNVEDKEDGSLWVPLPDGIEDGDEGGYVEEDDCWDIPVEGGHRASEDGPRPP